MLCTNEPCYTTGRSLRANILYRNTATGCFPMYWIPLLKEYRNGFVSKNKGRNLLTLDMPAISQPEAPSLFCLFACAYSPTLSQTFSSKPCIRAFLLPGFRQTALPLQSAPYPKVPRTRKGRSQPIWLLEPG